MRRRVVCLLTALVLMVPLTVGASNFKTESETTMNVPSLPKFNRLTYLFQHGFCGKGNLKIYSADDHRPLSQCEQTVADFWGRNPKLKAQYQIGVVLYGYVGGYDDRKHVNELLDLCLIPDDLFVVLRVDSAPGTTLPLVPVKGIHDAYHEGFDYYTAYAETVVDYLQKTPCSNRIDALIIGNEPTFTNPEVACKEQPKAFEYYIGDPASEDLRRRVSAGELGKEFQFCSVGWRNPKITQVITPQRYAYFFRAIALRLNRLGFGDVRIFVSGMELNAVQIYNPYLQALTQVGAGRFVDGIAVHVYSNSLGFTPPCQDQPWCFNKNPNLHGETLYFLGKFLRDLDPEYQGVPLYLTENNPWIGWGPHPADPNLSGRVEYLRLFLNTVEFLNSRGLRNQIVSWTPFGWSVDYDDPHGGTRLGLSQFQEVYHEGVTRFLSLR